MKKIEKTISRDLSLINIAAWHQGYTIGMKEWFGWGYSDSLFYVHDGYTDILRPPQEHHHDFKNEIIKHIENDKKWFGAEYKKFLKLVEEMNQFFTIAAVKVPKAANNELKEIYILYSSYVRRIVGPFLTMYWLPIFLEKDLKIQEKYKSVLKLAWDGRKQSEQIFPSGDELTNKILEKVNDDLKLGKGLLRLVSREEFLDYLDNNNFPKIDILQSRQNGFLYSKQGIWLVDSELELKKKLLKLGYEYEIQEVKSMKELNGQSACKGYAKGKARVILSKDKISTLQPGEILVASMTTPEYLSAMKKAAAFVTDEGGITCHAAIVSREMKKPCVIGTKYATKVLRNGQIVEVDADKGVIKMLSEQ